MNGKTTVMVSLISRHIGKNLMTSTIFLTIVLVTGVWLTQSLRFIEIIVNQNISIGGYFSLVGFLIPDLMVIVLPICTLIATIFTYNKLIADNEMAVFRSCGLSNIQIARPALAISFCLMILSYLINIYVVPLSFRQFRDLEYKIRTEVSANIIREGAFNNVRNTTIYTRKRGKKDDLYGVFIHHHAPPQQQKGTYSIIAERGFLSSINGRLHLILFNGNRQERDMATGKATFFHFSQLTYDLTATVSSAEERIIKPYERPLSELLSPPAAEQIGHATQSKMISEAHQRLISPLLILVFSLIATATMLSGQYNRRGRRDRILVAIAIAALTQIFMITLINMNSRFAWTIPCAYGLMILVGTGAFALLWRERNIFTRLFASSFMWSRGQK